MAMTSNLRKIELDALSHMLEHGGGFDSGSTQKWQYAMAMLRAASEAGASREDAWRTLKDIVRQIPQLNYNGEDYSFLEFASSALFHQRSNQYHS
ncbi:hypothetical protein FHS85_001646 [Rhodoligotrophos appendicifer]|uniref:hypothetical protein n=1 Tax=Rhodoligotrophos appendicifer TaxID=987056 RepID=UPI0011862B40|nr:hypothetical protein [Rhodoligotrophos appendicifer]